MGHPVKNIFVVSGFRTPIYNVEGGDPTGRASLSRPSRSARRRSRTLLGAGACALLA